MNYEVHEYWYMQYIPRITQTLMSVDVSVYQGFDLSTFRFADVIVCRRFGL